ncbi:muconolactone Delta-isomerase family protein [Candidatus Bathyarchaeota archaeon]|nr:muconolactone Delta-isomerase family protein [Candidatus Bathyarchaeota archaeon]
MRYLVEWELAPVPPQMAKTALALLEATEAWAEKEKKAGTHIENWAKTEGHGGITIVEAASNDALFKKIYENPYWPFTRYCVTPLTDFKLAIEISKNQLKQMAKG